MEGLWTEPKNRNIMKARLLEFLKSQGISQNAFEDSCNLTRGTITKLNLGLRSDKLAQIASAYPQLNLRWLLLGEGEMLENPNVNLLGADNINLHPGSIIHNVFVTNFADMKSVMVEAIKESRE